MAVKTQGLSGPALFLAAGGALLAYAGIKGASPITELRGILSGQRPEPLSTESSAAPLTDASPASADGASAASGGASGVVSAAASVLGAPYKWGATGPNRFDCSGLVYWAYNKAGLPIPRRTTYGYLVSREFRTTSNPQPGDIVVRPGHMGIYVGGGRMIHAPHTGSTVRYTNVPTRAGTGASMYRFRTYAGPAAQRRNPRAI